jgi:C-terminal processing protease CtpA/Prc
MLINEFDFSGGDAFPALMKDNGRVTLFGAQTTGAGGNVREYGPLANSFFKLSLTESLMVRPNGEYMENRGVKPDVEYTVTEDDFMNDYRGYVRAFTIEALKLTGVSQAEFEAFEAQQKLQKEAPTTPAVTGSVMGPR